MPVSEAYNMDCIQYMEQFPDNHFDLAIVDPPYGINAGNMGLGKGGGVAKNNNYKKKDWDKNAPTNLYFDELLRVSKNQIIWGANHFLGWVSPCWLVWDKLNGGTDYADCELAWASFDSPVRKFTYKWAGMLQQDMKNKEKRIHPTQKPVALYKWLLKNYAKEGDKILDTHLGSGSSRIAAWDMGFDFYATELDAEYFAAQEKRFNNFKMQGKLFA